MFRDIMRHLFTGADNQTHDVGRYLWVAGCIAFLVYSGFHAIKNGQFDYVQFGTGYGALLAGGGGALAMKKSTEPGG